MSRTKFPKQKTVKRSRHGSLRQLPPLVAFGCFTLPLTAAYASGLNGLPPVVVHPVQHIVIFPIVHSAVNTKISNSGNPSSAQTGTSSNSSNRSTNQIGQAGIAVSNHQVKPISQSSNNVSIGRLTASNQNSNQAPVTKTSSLPTGAYQLDLSSTKANIVLGSNLFAGAASVTINVGSSNVTFVPGQKVTAAEYVAIEQKLSSNSQSLVLNAQGAADAGKFNLNSTVNSNVYSLVVPKGVTGFDFFSQGSSLAVNGDLTNYGSIYVVSTNSHVTSGSISATEITNENGAVVSTSLPVAAASSIPNAAPNVSINLNALNNITNYGSISSSGALALTTAHGSISNVTSAAPAGLQSSGTQTALPSLTATDSVSLRAGNGDIVNAGTITSTDESINLGAPNSQNLTLSNLGGTLSATNGAINVRDGSYGGSANSNIVGGNLLSNQLNLNAGKGTPSLDVNQLTGVVNSTGNAAHVVANTPTLSLGSQNLTGDPTFFNTGAIQITGNISVGESLAIIAGGDVSATSSVSSIMAQFGSQGFDINIVAGANVVGVGTASPTIPSGTPATSASFTGAGNGGNVNLAAAASALTINSSSTGSGLNAGNITLAAYSNGTTGGQVNLPAGSTISASGGPGGTNGNVTIIGPSGISIGSISNGSSTAGANNVQLLAMQPTFSSGTSIGFGSNGAITTSNSLVGNSSALGIGAVSATGSLMATGAARITSGTGADITVSAITTGGNVLLNSGHDINLGTINANQIAGTAVNQISAVNNITAPGGVLFVSGQNFATGSSSPTFSTASSGNAGNITIVAGAAFTQNATSISITGASATGGNIDTETGTQFFANSTSSGIGGNVTLVTYTGTDKSAYLIAPAITTRGNGSSNANGNITIVSGDSSGNSAVELQSPIITIGGQSGTGNVTLATTTPAGSAANPVVLQIASGGGDFLGGAPAGSGIFVSASLQVNQLTATAGAAQPVRIIDSGPSLTISGVNTASAFTLQMTGSSSSIALGRGASITAGTSVELIATGTSANPASITYADNTPTITAPAALFVTAVGNIGTSSQPITFNSPLLTASAGGTSTTNDNAFLVDTYSQVSIQLQNNGSYSNSAGGTYSLNSVTDISFVNLPHLGPAGVSANSVVLVSQLGSIGNGLPVSANFVAANATSPGQSVSLLTGPFTDDTPVTLATNGAVTNEAATGYFVTNGGNLVTGGEGTGNISAQTIKLVTYPGDGNITISSGDVLTANSITLSAPPLSGTQSTVSLSSSSLSITPNASGLGGSLTLTGIIINTGSPSSLTLSVSGTGNGGGGTAAITSGTFANISGGFIVNANGAGNGSGGNITLTATNTLGNASFTDIDLNANGAGSGIGGNVQVSAAVGGAALTIGGTGLTISVMGSTNGIIGISNWLGITGATLTANTLVVQSQSTVGGNPASPLLINAQNVTASGGNGSSGVFLSDSFVGNVLLTNSGSVHNGADTVEGTYELVTTAAGTNIVTAGGGNGSITTNAIVFQTNPSSGSITLSSGDVLTANSITLSAGGGSVTSGATLNSTAGPNGNGGTISLSSPTLQVTGNLSANGTADGGTISIQTNSPTTLAIGTGGSNSVSGTLTVNGANSAKAGTISITNLGGAVLTAESLQSNILTLSGDTGVVIGGQLVAPAVTGTVYIDSGTGSIVYNTTAQAIYAGKSLTLASGGTIGTSTTPLAINTPTVNVNGASGVVNLSNVSSSGQTVNATATSLGGPFAYSGTGSITIGTALTVTSNLTISSSVLAPGGSAGNIVVSGNVDSTSGNVVLQTAGTQTISGSGIVGGQIISLITDSGEIGASGKPLNINAPNISVADTGAIFLNNVGTSGIALNFSNTTSGFVMTSQSGIAINSGLATAIAVGLYTQANNGSIVISGTIGSANSNVTLAANGTGTIQQVNAQGFSVQGNSVNLSGASGGIFLGIETNNITANGSGIISLGNFSFSASAVGDSSAATSFSIGSNGSLYLNNISTSNGFINVLGDGALLEVNSAAQLTAANSFVLLRQANTATGDIVVLGGPTTLQTTGTGGVVTVIIGSSVPTPVTGVPPSTVTINSKSGGQAYFGTNSISVPVATATLNLEGSNIQLSTGTRPDTAVVLGPGVTITADPIGSVLNQAQLNQSPAMLTGQFATFAGDAGAAAGRAAPPLALTTSSFETAVSQAAVSGVSLLSAGAFDSVHAVVSSSPPNLSSNRGLVSAVNSASMMSALGRNPFGNQAFAGSNTAVDTSAGSTNAGNAASITSITGTTACANPRQTIGNDWISDTELITGKIPAILKSDEDFGITSDVSMVVELSEEEQAAELLQIAKTGIPLTGSVSRTVGGARVVTLNRGSVVFAPLQDTKVRTPFGTVNVDAKSVVLMMSFGRGLAVFDLDDSHFRSVVVNVGSHELVLGPGTHAVITSKSVDRFEQVNPAQLIGHCNMREQDLGLGLKAFLSEFSIMQAIRTVTPLVQLVSSKHKPALNLADHMLKTAAILQQMTAGTYEQLIRPIPTTYQPQEVVNTVSR